MWLSRAINSCKMDRGKTRILRLRRQTRSSRIPVDGGGGGGGGISQPAYVDILCRPAAAIVRRETHPLCNGSNLFACNIYIYIYYIVYHDCM